MSMKETNMKRGLTVALILAICAFAAHSGAEKKAERRYILLNPESKLPFSNGVLVGDTLYVAGSIGLDAKTGHPPAELEDEARLVLDGVRNTLVKAGMTMDDLVAVEVYCSDVANYAKFNEVYRTYFQREFPARAFLGSGPLLFGARFEVKGIAVKR
jgi:2-iminobutanoate/2-iminopropanoate deaminase